MKTPSRKTEPASATALEVMPARAVVHESSFREVVEMIEAMQRAGL